MDAFRMGIKCKDYLRRYSLKELEKLNKDLEISSEGLAIIPTEYNTEILCYEFKGKVDEKEFLVQLLV